MRILCGKLHTPPAIYVCILEIRGVKQSLHGFFCTYVWAPTITTAIKVFCPKKLVNVIGTSQIPI